MENGHKKQPGISFPDCSDCRQIPAKAGFLLLLRPFFGYNKYQKGGIFYDDEKCG